MAIGDPGAEQFRNMILTFRNRSLIAAMQPLLNLRTELVVDDALQTRIGLDNATKNHYLQLLVNADRYRRALTYNPEDRDIKTLMDEAKDLNVPADIGENPFAGDSIQHGNSGMVMVPWDFSGADPNIPTLSQLQSRIAFSSNGLLLMGAVDDGLVAWTRLESRKLARFITVPDSLRMYENYQSVLAYLKLFAGDENFIDFAQVLPTEEPRGSDNAPNRLTETLGGAGFPGGQTKS